MEGSGEMLDAPVLTTQVESIDAIVTPAAPLATEDGTTGMLNRCVHAGCNAVNTTGSITDTGF